MPVTRDEIVSRLKRILIIDSILNDGYDATHWN